MDAVYDRRGAAREATEATVRHAVIEALRERDTEPGIQAAMALGSRLDLDGAYRLAME